MLANNRFLPESEEKRVIIFRKYYFYRPCALEVGRGMW